jgi:DNA-binding CsgD family transcriptional regulator
MSAADRPGGTRAWLFLEGDATSDLPDAWRERSRPATLIPLLPGEARDVLAEGRAEPALDPADESLVALAGQGLSTGEIARRLQTPQRSVQRRLARVRRKLGFTSNEQLATFAAQVAIGDREKGAAPDEA